MKKEKIQKLAHSYHQETIAVRRHLHQNPELSYEEVAQELEIPLGTVKAQLFRARELLNQELKNLKSQM